MSLFDDLPIHDYYKPHVLDARTLMRSGQWWRAAVLIRDPNTNKTFLNFYLWRKIDGQWVRRESFKIRKRTAAKKLLDYLDGVWAQIEEGA